MSRSRKFIVSWTTECEITLDEEVIDVVDDGWREMLYDLNTPEEIAEHIAFNIVVNNAGLSRLDGWANLKDNMARVTSEDRFFWESREIKENKGVSNE